MTGTAQFRKTIYDHYRANRREMPWRRTRDPYRILVSEIMLQQTQAARVERFYGNFIRRFPDLGALSRARTPDVLRAWQGLGYNRRALALQRLAREVVRRYQGKLPRDRAALVALPGIGDYTAGAVRAFAWNEPEVFIETNIRRVFIHFFFPRRKKVTDAELRRYIERTLDGRNPREWYFALMDYGAMLGEAARQRRHSADPNRRSARYVRQAAFSGSDREIRGKVLRTMLERKRVPAEALFRSFGIDRERMAAILGALAAEGFIAQRGNYLCLKNI
ncbi:MAG TPA: A/G-specific adenine glycosylase [Candidatus Paceibacterota bacterium]|nr:A/G-specific adenine glycosylase [Candidatus Paceibacterota bacterium]